jgi:hypothetical protein
MRDTMTTQDQLILTAILLATAVALAGQIVYWSIFCNAL